MAKKKANEIPVGKNYDGAVKDGDYKPPKTEEKSKSKETE